MSLRSEPGVGDVPALSTERTRLALGGLGLVGLLAVWWVGCFRHHLRFSTRSSSN
jgi:hypothetical protein